MEIRILKNNNFSLQAIQRVLLVLLFSSTLLPISFAADDTCSLRITLTKIFKSLRRKTAHVYVEDKVELIWFPKSKIHIVSHTEINVEGTVYNSFGGLEKRTDIEKAVERAKSGGKAFFRFKLAVTEDELKNIKDFIKINKGKSKFQTCVSGVCKVITKSTDIKIPPPFSKSPALASIYLTVVHKLGYKRIVKIEYVGKSAFRSLIGTEIPFELGLVQAVGFLIVYALNELGQIVKLFVPIESISNFL